MQDVPHTTPKCPVHQVMVAWTQPTQQQHNVEHRGAVGTHSGTVKISLLIIFVGTILDCPPLSSLDHLPRVAFCGQF